MKNYLAIFFAIISLQVFAEETNKTSKKGSGITATVIDGINKKAVEYATVALYQTNKKELVTGGVSDSEGFFKLKNIPMGNYYLSVTFMGYKTKKIQDISVTESLKTINLGTIKLFPNNKEIGEVNVIADQASIQYKIDKKVVNVSQQLTAKSGTAVDVLENVPSVKVDIDGNVSLRGSSDFTVLIDGRPTVLEPSDALAQIPSGAIENIEIITNPSAKYEPDGTSGIINIITKKNKLNGLSGVINLNSGTNKKFDKLYSYGADFTVDMRTEKWHYYIGADFNNRERIGDIKYDRFQKNTIGSSTINSIGNFERNSKQGSVRGGADWNFSENDNIGVNFSLGNRNNERVTDKEYSEKSPLYPEVQKSTTNDLSTREGKHYSVSLDYKHTFNKTKDNYLQFSSTLDGGNMDEITTNNKFSLQNKLLEYKKASETGPYAGYQIKLDYSQPFAWGGKLETGIQVRNRQHKDYNEVYYLDTLLGKNNVVLDANQNKTTAYTRSTYAAYSTFGGELGNFGYQAGLRVEYTYRFLELIDDNKNYTINRPDYFPTLHFSYNMPKKQQVMLSYSRRIVRPKGWNLEPFITTMDALNVRRGNPNLQPEYVSSMELGYQKKFGRNFVSAETYYRFTQNKIERIMLPYENTQSILHTYTNAGTATAVGVELMANYSPAKWYTSNFMADFYDYKISGNTQELTNQGFSWMLRSSNTIKASQNTRFQVDLMYQSDMITSQGTFKGFFGTSLAWKQDYFKRKLSSTLQIRDLFSNWRHEFETNTQALKQYTLFEPYTPSFTITLSYKINNYKAKRKQGGSGADMEEGGSDF